MSNLLLDSLEIRNFRAFKHLRIEKLGRVNLIVGKNNIGKSSVLDALRVYALRGEPATIRDLLNERNELTLVENEVRRNSVNAHDFALAINNLFHERSDTRKPHDAIVVGSARDIEKTVLLDVVWPVLRVVNSNGDIKADNLIQGLNQEPTLSGRFGTHAPFDFPLDAYYKWGSFAETSERIKRFNLFYIGIIGLKPEVTAFLWDAIALSDVEQDVLAALRIIAPQVDAVNLIKNSGLGGERIPIIRIIGTSQRVPLRSMGEGMNRMFGIALALVNAKDGMLLVDEVDTGLHYSVLFNLWKLIFEVAHRLNVQVFATSHSWECIQAFQQAAEDNKEEQGVLIRLENRKVGIRAVTFDEDDLAIVTREHIEVR